MSFKIIMTTFVTRPCFTTQHQICTTKTDFLVSDQSCPKTDGLRPHHCLKQQSIFWQIFVHW